MKTKNEKRSTMRAIVQYWLDLNPGLALDFMENRVPHDRTGARAYYLRKWRSIQRYEDTPPVTFSYFRRLFISEVRKTIAALTKHLMSEFKCRTSQ